jgi:hypothetical protein
VRHRDQRWSVKVVADSEASAVELAMGKARALNHEKGMPPHGIRLRDDDLRTLATVCGDVPRGDAAGG